MESCGLRADPKPKGRKPGFDGGTQVRMSEGETRKFHPELIRKLSGVTRENCKGWRKAALTDQAWTELVVARFRKQMASL